VLGNLIQDRSIDGLVGADEAVVRLDAGTPRIAISPLVKAPATTIYAGPSDQLGISKSRDDLVPALVAERGHPLALKVDQRLRQASLIDRLLRKDDFADVSRDDLWELGTVARIDQIPDDEREALIAAVVPAQPLLKERQRVSTYAALLALAQRMKAFPAEADVFDAACSIGRFGEPILDDVADGWLTYCVRDSIAVTQEAVLTAIMAEIMTSPEAGLAGIERGTVIAALMERIDEHADGLRALQLLGASEAVSDLSFRELYSRLEARLSDGLEQRRGLARWTADLSEPQLYTLAQRSGAGALTLAVVAWIVAAIRVGAAVKEDRIEFGGLSYQGWRRFGLRDVVLPELERFHRENRSLRDIAAELARRTVQQHLQIAWSRLEVDVRRDVALLTAEGSQWFSRGKGFSGGRTASRLRQALGWLTQLKLVDGNGITADGDLVFKRALRILADGASA
jgi:hypothetical protein